MKNKILEAIQKDVLIDWKEAMHEYVVGGLLHGEELVKANMTKAMKKKYHPYALNGAFHPQIKESRTAWTPNTQGQMEIRNQIMEGVLDLDCLLTTGSYLGQLRNLFLAKKINKNTLIRWKGHWLNSYFLGEIGHLSFSTESGWRVGCEGGTWGSYGPNCTETHASILMQFDIDARGIGQSGIAKEFQKRAAR